MGGSGSNFEQNLTGVIGHGKKIITLSLKPAETFSAHVSDFYIKQFIEKSGLSSSCKGMRHNENLLKTTGRNIDTGRKVLKEAGVDLSKGVVIIHSGSEEPEKYWCLDNFLAVAKEPGLKNSNVIFIVGSAGVERSGDVKIAGISSASRCLKDLFLKDVSGG